MSGLVKTFGATRALDGLDLSVRAGEVHGFLGPNGAGKSTTLRIVLGLIRKNDGVVRLFGGDPWAEAASLHRRLAYVPGDVSLWPNLSGGQVIDLLLRMRGAPADHPWRAEMVDRFELDPTKKGRAYSKGNRQKVALVAAFAAPADLLILDEPTSGLDPLMEEVFAACVTERRAQGTTVLLSSHILSEVERLADRVTIIRDGRVVESGSLQEMRHLHRSRVRAEVTGQMPDLTGVPGVHDVSVDGSVVSCTVGLRWPAPGPDRPHGGRREQPDQHTALVGGAVPGRLPPPGGGCSMTGVAGLTRLALRRSRLLMAVWTAVLVLVAYASAAATGGLYSTAAEQVAAARTINGSPALVALYGPILDVHSLGELAMTKMTVTYALFVMALAVTLVRRHTRVDEESGRAELLGGLAVDQSAPLVSAVLVGVAASLATAALAGCADVAGGLPATGSLWFAGSWLGVGLVGTGIGAVAAQLLGECAHERGHGGRSGGSPLRAAGCR